MSIRPSVLKVLQNIRFVERYTALAGTSETSAQCIPHVDTRKAAETIAKLGYKAVFHRNENVFLCREAAGPLQFHFNIAISRGLIELLWLVNKNGAWLDMGVPGGNLGWICKAITNQQLTRMPGVRSYEELDELLRGVFTLWEDFKRGLIAEEIGDVLPDSVQPVDSIAAAGAAAPAREKVAVTNPVGFPSLAPDIYQKLSKDFGVQLPEALAALAELEAQTKGMMSDRLLRAIVFLGGGHLEDLKWNISAAREESQSVLWRAESEHGSTRIHDFSKTFHALGLMR
jgi:hypothetical protein